jgi:nucleotide-binding universal stress UspA family protein
MNIEHILVPCDFSGRSGAALRYARMFVGKFPATLTVMYADPVLFPVDILGTCAPAVYASGGLSDEDLERELREYAMSHLGPSVRFNTKVVGGSAPPMIVKTANDIGADLIIIATRGLHGWRRTLLGSVTVDVLHAFDRSVLVIEPPESPEVAEAKISRILCPVNMTEIARQAAREASALATRFNAQLIMVHVAEDRSPIEESERRLRKWLANDVKPDVAWREIVVRGGAAERVLDCADDLQADLLVIGAQHNFLGDATVIGATTERLIRFAKCPVLTVIRASDRVSETRENEREMAHTQ